MRTIPTLKILLSAILFGFAPFGRAAIPAGNFTINVSGQVPIWDVSGDYSNSLGNLAIDFTLNVDNKGRITGAGAADIADDVEGGQFHVELHSDFSYTGTINSSAGVTRVKFKFKIKGTGILTDDDGVDHPATLNSTLNVSAEVDENSHVIMGTISGSISAKANGLGSESQKIQAEEYSLPLPDDMDGSWRVDLSGVQVTGKKISGTAVVHLSNGRTVGLQVTGTYDAVKDIATYNLKGTAQQSSSGDSLKVTGVNSGAGVAVRSFSGKMLGQTLKLPTASSASASSASTFGYQASGDTGGGLYKTGAGTLFLDSGLYYPVNQPMTTTVVGLSPPP